MILIFRGRFSTKLFGPNITVAKLKRYNELIKNAFPPEKRFWLKNEQFWLENFALNLIMTIKCSLGLILKVWLLRSTGAKRSYGAWITLVITFFDRTAIKLSFLPVFLQSSNTFPRHMTWLLNASLSSSPVGVETGDTVLNGK